jgi:nitrate/nitrite transporter NarK
MYGLGLLVSPFVATAVAIANHPSKWTLFYLFPLALSITNLVLVLVAFKDSIKIIPRSASGDNSCEAERGQSAITEVKQMLKLGHLWVFCLFFFFYLGICMTSAGTNPCYTLHFFLA